MLENSRWLVIPTSITGSIDFNEVLQSSPENLRTSVDGTKTVIKYDITEITASYEEYHPDAENPEVFITSSFAAGIYGRPSFYSEEYPEYTHEDILTLLETDEWTLPITEA